MTIEEWLDKRIEDTEKNCREKHLDAYDNGYWDGYYDALDDLLRELPLFEHEVTLREFKEFCQTHEQCSRCSVVDMCRFDCPRIWELEEMERRMKYEEEHRARRKEDGND